MALTQDNKKMRKFGSYYHQAAHSDFANSKFQHLNHCCLLNGLVKPFAVNIPIEDERSIYIGSPSDIKTIYKNGLLIMGGDTVHGGTSYLFQAPPKYHPSVHFVFSSTRFKKDTNAVSLNSEPTGYVSKHGTKLLSDEDIELRWTTLLTELKETAGSIFDKKRVDKELGGQAFDALALFTETCTDLYYPSEKNKESDAAHGSSSTASVSQNPSTLNQDNEEPSDEFD